MASRAPEGTPVPDDKHGTPNAYTYYRCRCETCRAGWASYRAARRSTGTDDREVFVRRKARRERQELQRAIRRHRAVWTRTRVEIANAVHLDSPVSFGSVQVPLAEIIGSDGSGHPEWEDPTFDAAMASIEAEEVNERAAIAAWNRAANPRDRAPFLTAEDLTRVPSGGNGLVYRMAPQHRGRNARAAAAQGKRSSRSQSKAAR